LVERVITEYKVKLWVNVCI